MLQAWNDAQTYAKKLCSNQLRPRDKRKINNCPVPDCDSVKIVVKCSDDMKELMEKGTVTSRNYTHRPSNQRDSINNKTPFHEKICGVNSDNNKNKNTRGSKYQTNFKCPRPK